MSTGTAVVKLLANASAPTAEARTVSGWASTADIDRVGDIVMPEGMRARLPLPLLAAHDQNQIIGAITALRPDSKGVFIEARIAEGVSKADECWKLVRQGALTHFSIGFIGLKSEPLKNGARRWTEWELTECSMVACPANPSAIVTSSSNAKALQNQKVSRGAVRLLEIPSIQRAYQSGDEDAFVAACNEAKPGRYEVGRQLANKVAGKAAPGRASVVRTLQVVHAFRDESVACDALLKMKIDNLAKRIENIESGGSRKSAAPKKHRVVWLTPS